MTVKIKILFNFLLIYSILFTYSFILPKNVEANTIVYEDNFNNHDSSMWNTITNNCNFNSEPAPWIFNNGRYGIKINNLSGVCSTNNVYKATIPIGSEYSYEIDMLFSGSIYKDRNILFKYQDTSNYAELHIIGKTIYLERFANGHQSTNNVTYDFEDNTLYRFRINVLKEKIEIYINDSFIVSANEDINNIPNLTFGLRAGVGKIHDTEVWFDNLKVTYTSTNKLFNLPIHYTNRKSSNTLEFNSTFWARETAVFDHARKGGLHIPFTGESYKSNQCPKNTYGEKCYDSHNGTDFSKAGGEEVYSVADGGTVLYTSKTDDKTKDCTPDKGGYGCVIIVKYADNLLGLYAHLSQILVTKDQEVNEFTQIGVMGNTGCKPKCGVHLHFSVLKSNQTKPANPMTDSDWRSLLYDMMPEVETSNLPSPTPAAVKSAFCSYKAPNEQIYYFVDHSGWKGSGPDPWSLAKEEHGCAIPTENLWKFDLVKNSTSQTILPIFPNLFPI